MSAVLTLYFIVLPAWIVGLVALAAYGVEQGVRGEYADFRRVGDWIAALLRRGYDRGYLRMGHRPSRQFLEFRKLILGPGDYRLTLSCFGMNWSQEHLDRARSVAAATGLPTLVEPLHTSEGLRDGLIVECGRDAVAAFGVARTLWTDALGLTTKTKFKALCGGWSVLDELIDGPDHPPPIDSLPPDRRLRELDLRLRRLDRRGVPSLMVSAICVVLLLISGLGLPLDILVSGDGPLDWTFAIGSVELAGSLASLLFFVTLVAAIIGIRLTGPRRPTSLSRWERRSSCLGAMIFAVLPIAVFLAWAGF